MASPSRFSSRYRNDLEDSEPPRRIGMSDYTSQRLAALRARRAEMELNDSLKSDVSSPVAHAASASQAVTTSSLGSPSKISSTSRLTTSSLAPRDKDSTGSTITSSTPSSEYRSTASASVTLGGTPSSEYRSTTSVTGTGSVGNTPSSDYRSRYRTERTTDSNMTSTSKTTSPLHEPRKIANGSISSSSTDSSRNISDYKGISLERSDSSKLTATQDYKISLDRNDSQLSSRSQRSNGMKEDGDEIVGFSSLPEQVHRKAVKRGFDFTLMVVGETGLGKSTLVNSLFLTDLYKDRKIPNVEDRIAKTVSVEKKYVEFEERGVRLRLTIVDTPGFNDSVDSNECWQSVEAYIDQQFEQYLKDEMGLNRRNIKDHRVHCCLYFISPYGHGLKQMDVQFMKRLHDKVNIVPIIAKADTLTMAEIKQLKARILDEIDKHKINIYEFPECDSDEDEDFKQQDKELKAAIPFAVIGSNTVIDVGGKKIRGRQYPWGIVEVDNPKHCDFCKLRQMLIGTHMQDLKEVTRDMHYENFRARQLATQMGNQQRERMRLKRESQMSMDGLSEADRLLQQKDEEIRKMQEMLAKMQNQMMGARTQVNGLGNL